MMSLREWLNEFTSKTGETPESLVLAWGWKVDEDWLEWDRWGKVTPLADVPNEILDRQFDDGYGGTESPNLCGWSPSWVLFSDQYDGAEGIVWVPRAPIDHTPIRPGGG